MSEPSAHGPEARFDAGPRFEVRRQLGTGGMGVVYEAFDRERQMLVALKTLRVVDEQWLTRFKREFRANHELSHPNLVALDELFDGASVPFYTMELLRGEDLMTYVRGPLADVTAASAVNPLGETQARGAASAHLAPPAPAGEPAIAPPRRPFTRLGFHEARLRAALRQLAMGVSALHAAGKVHRDIKPSNIIVTPEGRVVLCDFGLLSETTRSPALTDDGIVGTVAYMAPEQALESVPTAAADWYSVGVVLFEALTGVVPHSGRTRYDVLLRKQKYEPPPPRQLVPDVPPDLDALCVDLLQREPRDRPLASEIFARLGVGGDAPTTAMTVSTGASLAGAPPFVGRGRELAALRAAYDAAAVAPRICLVEGISGVGKTQLVEHFLQELGAAEPDALVLTGRCYEREVVAYKAFDGLAESLSRYLRQLPPGRADALMPRRAALVGRLFASLRRVEAVASAPPVPELPDPHDQRRRTFAALRELFLRISRHRRLVWYVDDLQWADADSLVLLQDLLAHEEHLPVLLVATVRPIEGDAASTLAAKLAELAPLDRHELRELGAAEARELAERLMPASAPAAVERVVADTGGHPLLLIELARHAAADPRARAASLDDLLAARIDQLGPVARRLLQVIAVFGGPLTQEVAALAAQCSDAELVQAARILRAANLARTGGARKHDQIVLYHDRVREHVSRSLDDEARRLVHARLALALEQTGAAEHAPRALVRHARAAGQPALAGTHARRAAEHAAASLAFDQAAELYAEALQLGDFDDATRRALRIQQATALVDAGRGPEAAQVYMTAAEGADPAVRLECQRLAADQWIITGHIDRGMEALRTSLADIGEPLAATPRAALARVAWNRARLRLRGLQFTPRRESQVAEEELRQLDVLKAVAHGLGMVDNVRGADFNGRFLLAALRIGVPERLIQALATEVMYLASQGGGAGRRGRKVFAQLERIGRDAGETLISRIWTLLADGGASYLEGRFAQAVAALRECEDLVREHTTGTTFLRNNTRVLRVHALRQLGALRQNEALIADALRSGRQRGDRYLETTLLLIRGTCLLAQDRPDEARAAIAAATWSPPEDGYHMQHWSELRTRVEIALYEGTAGDPAAALLTSFERVERSKIQRIQIIHAEALSARARLRLAVAATGGADAAAARHDVTRLIRRLEAMATGFATVYARLLRAALVASDADAVVEHLRVAASEAERLGMALHLAAARHYLGRRLAGAEGAALLAAAVDYAAREGIVAPERLFAMVAPGL